MYSLRHHTATVLYIYTRGAAVRETRNSSAISPHRKRALVNMYTISRRAEERKKRKKKKNFRKSGASSITCNNKCRYNIITRLTGMKMKSLWAIDFRFALLPFAHCNWRTRERKEEAGRGGAFRIWFTFCFSLSGAVAGALDSVDCYTVQRSCLSCLSVPFITWLSLIITRCGREDLANRRQMGDQAAGTNGF